MEYTKKTFSSQRYEIWSNCSRWHNTPEVNNSRQICGRAYRASDVSFSKNDESAEFSAEIRNAYEPISGINSWVRTVSMDKAEKQLEISDNFKLESASDDIKIYVITQPKPRINGNQIILSNEGINMELVISENFNAEFETIQLSDHKMIKDWGNSIYRIILKANKKQIDGNCKMICRLI